jgi:hypothetical protein
MEPMAEVPEGSMENYLLVGFTSGDKGYEVGTNGGIVWSTFQSKFF